MNEKDKITFLQNIIKEKIHIDSPLLGGMMNDSLIIKSENNNKYVAYFPTVQANEMVDRQVEKEALDIAYQLQITNKNIYFDLKSGIKINSYIEGNSLNNLPSFDYQKVANLLRKFHSSKKLSSSNYEPFKRFVDIYEKEAFSFQKNIDSQYLQLKSFLFRYQSYLEKQPLSLCHNDAQKSNILCDSNNKYYLIDFEFAGNNDPIYDIATFGNGSVKEGRTLLDYYFDGSLKIDDVKRYYLWRIFISLQWYNVAITKHFRGEGEVHRLNFLDVAHYFLENAKEAYQSYQNEIKE